MMPDRDFKLTLPAPSVLYWLAKRANDRAKELERQGNQNLGEDAYNQLLWSTERE